MLNISENIIVGKVDLGKFKSTQLIRKTHLVILPRYIILIIFLISLLFLFLPWTQNISAKGYVSSLQPNQKPHAIQSVLDGRIEKWYVRDGQWVEAGDTILFISEIKNEYFDSELIERTTEQLEAKRSSVNTYKGKVAALKKQYAALQESMKLKTEQTKNKIQQALNKITIDSVEVRAAEISLSLSENQYERTKELYEQGLKSLSELQVKELKWQESIAKLNSIKNKLLNARNEWSNYNIELNAVLNNYYDKLAKSESDKFTAISSQLSSEADVAKLRNQLENYKRRRGLYHVVAPQEGRLTQTIKKGIGEVVKSGSDIATIMPAQYDLVIEVYVDPVDLPLLQVDDRARLRFDGWPALVISGWPEAATGIFTGRVLAIDEFISDNGKYRLLIQPDNQEKDWPQRLRVGTGTNAFILLNDVPLWYEVWRQLNGFPPEYYGHGSKDNDKPKLKAPIKLIK